jgi:hypothetical protein
MRSLPRRTAPKFAFVLGLFTMGTAAAPLLVTGCKSHDAPNAEAGADAAPAVSTAADVGNAEAARKKTEVLPPPEIVAQANNPKGAPTYSGPTATVRGVVRAVGDDAPTVTGHIDTAKPDCPMSRPMFGKLFREGNERRLADVLVAVTGYDVYVKPKAEVVTVEGRGCAWDRRTVAMTFGQRLDVVGADRRPYVPDLLGQTNVAQMFVLPGADAVKLVPRKPGRFLLLDSMRLYNRAEVFVLTYPTAAVTGLDGKFEIQGIPVGKVKVSAYLPQTDAVVEKEVEVVAGQPLDLELELPFDAAAFAKNPVKSDR